MKTACVYHAIDLDGWMSAAIVKHWFNIEKERLQEDEAFKSGGSYSANPNGTIDFISYNYGQSIPYLGEYNNVIMCDISFPDEEMNRLIDFPNNPAFIWIDHHISAISNPKINENWASGLRSTTKAACELTWEYFFPNTKMPEIVRLLGRYDCFGHMGTSEEKTVVEFQYGARECIFDYETAYAYLVDEGTEFKNPEINTLNIILEKGKSIYGYLCTEAKQVYQNGFEIELISWPESKESDGTVYKFICINKERFNAINFGIDYHAQGYDGQACFFRTKEGKWSFSFYSQTVDCSAIAKQFGGGGHKGAAGCVVDNETMLNIINS